MLSVIGTDNDRNRYGFGRCNRDAGEEPTVKRLLCALTLNLTGLRRSYFMHEIVTCSIAIRSSSLQVPLELVRSVSGGLAFNNFKSHLLFLGAG